MPLTSPILDTQIGSRGGFSRVDSAARRYTFGLSFEFHLAGPLALETGFLYKRLGFDSASSGGAFISGPRADIVSSTTGHAWEFPFLAKSRVRLVQDTHLTLAAGPVLRRIAGLRETGTRTLTTFFPPPTTTVTEPFDTTAPASFDRRTSIGGAIGAGVEFPVGALRLAPGLRLTYWDTERTSGMPSGSRLNRTQLDALLTIAYAPRDQTMPALPIGLRSFEFGVLAGVPLLATTEVEYFTSDFSRSIDAPTRRFSYGAYIARNLSRRFSLEASFLTRRFGHSDTTDYRGFVSYESIRGNLWEAPLLAKFLPMPTRALRPVFGVGPAIRRASHVEWITGATTAPFRLSGASISRTALGLAASAGVEWSHGPLRLRPELRFALYERRPYDLGIVRAQDHSLHFVLALGYTHAQ